MYKIILNFNIEILKEKNKILNPLSYKSLIEKNVPLSGLKSVSGETEEECINKIIDIFKLFEEGKK